MKIQVSVGISTLFLLEYYHCYENICRRNSTTVLQSSTYDNQQETLAIDGDLRTKYRYCAHTDVNQTVAWLQVDLGKPYSISNVTLYYRKDGLGNNEWQPYRFRQFYLDVSDLPATQKTTAHRTRCYTDNTTHPDVLPHIIDIPCKHTVRYVIVETTYDAPEDDPTTGAILEICEIEVYGCETGEYGDDCKPCSECKTCDVNNGICGDSMVSIECTGENNLPGCSSPRMIKTTMRIITVTAAPSMVEVVVQLVPYSSPSWAVGLLRMELSMISVRNLRNLHTGNPHDDETLLNSFEGD
ncbi:uncharacterized protein [Magallana gigas]|uniref:uncharacterized protein n=1 Tax=Magallana gigas TaxID=29159 RepID=UPI003340F983